MNKKYQAQRGLKCPMCDDKTAQSKGTYTEEDMRNAMKAAFHLTGRGNQIDEFIDNYLQKDKVIPDEDYSLEAAYSFMNKFFEDIFNERSHLNMRTAVLKNAFEACVKAGYKYATKAAQSKAGKNKH